MPAATADEDLTPAQAAVVLGRSEITVRRLVRSGQLPARRVMGRVLIRRADAERLAAGELITPAGRA